MVPEQTPRLLANHVCEAAAKTLSSRASCFSTGVRGLSWGHWIHVSSVRSVLDPGRFPADVHVSSSSSSSSSRRTSTVMRPPLAAVGDDG
jgi:hypothetical protein